MKASTAAIGLLGAALLVVALLLPVGDAPWYSFWREWTATIAVLLIVLGTIASLRDLDLPLLIPARSLAVAAIGLALLCWLQFAFGLLPYRSDALMASLYLVAFGLCVIVASSLHLPQRDQLADRLAAAMALAALVSVPLAVLQWIGWLRLDMGLRVPGGRPVAHMEQANLLCSLFIQGAFGIWRLAAGRRLGPRMALVLLSPILLGIVLTQSRVAWLVALATLCITAWRRDVIAGPRVWRVLVASLFVVVAGTLLLPWIDGFVGLQGAALSERISEGRRPAAWGLFLDAAMTHPWAGWGVLQNGTAQFALADRHPALAYVFSSAHNIVLDLIVWFGIPVGLLAGALLLWALVRRIAQASNVAALATALAATALVLHALVELPLHYAYFFLPLGLYLGVTAGCRDAGPTLRVATRVRALLPALSLIAALALSSLGQEYIRLTDVRPTFGIDKETRHPKLLADLPPPNVLLLDQLQAFHVFAALPLASGVSAPELDAAKVAMRRSPFSASIERYALLAGLNGRESESRDSLARVCKFETPRQCERSQIAWGIWRERWPQLPDAFAPAPSGTAEAHRQ